MAKKYAILPFILAFLLLSFTSPPPTGPVHGRAKTQPRPTLSGPVLSYGTEHFIIHYTLEGEDAVSQTDDDGDGLPDYVEAVAEAAEFSWQQEVERMGWRAPLPDGGEGGDTRLDVYLKNQFELFGYVETYAGFIGDNPTTTAKEDRAAYGYLGLDNDYELDNPGGIELTPLDAMRTTVAHELHHAIQAAYDDNDPYEWLYEASAVWIEDKVYPEIGDAQSYLTDYMDAPDLCPLSVGRDDLDVRWYGDWILLRYISEHHGGPQTIQRLWEHMAILDGLEALETTLAEQGTTLAEVLLNFSIANLTKSNCPTNTPYCYDAHGSDYLRPYVEGTVRIDAGEVDTLIPRDGVQQFGTDYVRLKSKGPILVDFQGSQAGQWAVRLVGLDDGQATVTPLADPGPTLIDASQFDRLYLVIVNTAPVETEVACGYHNYTLALADPATGQQIKAPLVPADPGPYLPPTYTDSTPFPSDGRPIKAEESPFPPLYPGYLPVDYTLTQIISYTVPELGKWEQDYAPGGEPIIVLEYTGINTETYISITQSPAPYDSVARWVEAQGYYENDVRLVNSKPVYLLDYSSEAGPFSSATFVHHNLFVVIDGTIDWIEMQQVVAGFLINNP